MRYKLFLSTLILILLLTSTCNFIKIPGIHRNEKTYYIDYENGTIPISELPIGSRVEDLTWEWEYRFGENYSEKNWHADQTKTAIVEPITWIIVAHDFYEGADKHVTLLSEDLIACYAFDDSTERGSEYGSNHWGDSGAANAEHGLRPWLNSEGIHNGEGFYRAFSDRFKQAIIAVDLPNCEWDKDRLYTTKENVFIPSAAEIGRQNGICGETYPYFSGIFRSMAKNRIARLGNLNMWYWTRTPASASDMLIGVNPGGGFMDYVANHGDHAVRPVINLSSEVLVSENKPYPGDESIADQDHIERATGGDNIRIPGIDYENLVVSSLDTKIAAGLYYSLIIDDVGDLYYLGKNNFYDFNGIVLEFLQPTEISTFKIEGVADARSVTTGMDNALVLLNNGDLFTLNTNINQHFEQIPDSIIIKPEKVDNLPQVKAVSVGYNHALILLDNGDLYAFGHNESGQLGLGNSNNQDLPVLIESLSDVAAISAGNKHSLAVLGNGDLYAFGSNSYGQLGLGDQVGRNEPVLIDTLSGVVAVAAGADHSLVLLGNGDVYAFGNGLRGQLGQGDSKHYLLPAKIEGLSNIETISAGDDFSLILNENGAAYSFGFAPHLGLGESSYSGIITVPSEITGIETVTSIAAGVRHSLLSTDTGDIYYFGNILPESIIFSPQATNLIRDGKIADLPYQDRNEDSDQPTLTGYWQGIVEYHEYNHAQVLLHFSEDGSFTAAFPQSGYLCIFKYLYFDQSLYVFNPFASQWNGPVMINLHEGESISFPGEQLKDTPDQELQGFGLFSPLDENRYHNLTKNLEIYDFRKP